MADLSSTQKHILALVAAAATGLLTWVGVSFLSHEVEAFDAPSYFTIALPLVAIACAVLGFAAPWRAWLYGLVAMGMHGLALVSLAMTGPEMSMLPVGLAILGMIAIPMCLSGMAGAWARRQARPPGPK